MFEVCGKCLQVQNGKVYMFLYREYKSSLVLIFFFFKKRVLLADLVLADCT